MSEETDGNGWLEGIEEAGEGVVESAGHVVHEGNEAFVQAAEAIGVEAPESLLSSEARAIPVVGPAIAGADLLYQDAAAGYDLGLGDYDKASDHVAHMAEDVLNVATGGLSGGFEGGWDIANAVHGGGESTSAHGELMQGVDAAADEIVDVVQE